MPLDKNKSSKPIVSGEVTSSYRQSVTDKLQTITTSSILGGVMQSHSVAPSQYLGANKTMASLPVTTGNVVSLDVASSCTTCQQTSVSRQQQCHHHHHHHHYNAQKQRRLASGGNKALVGGAPNSSFLATTFEQENSTTCSSSGGENISLSQQAIPLASSNNAVQSTVNTTSPLPPALKIRLYELFGQIEREFEVLYSENLGLQERLDQLSTSGHSNLLPGSASTSTISTLTNNLHLLGDVNLNNQPQTEFVNKASQMYSCNAMQTSSQKDPNQADLTSHRNHEKQQQSVHKFQQSQHPYQPPSHQQNMQQMQQPPLQKNSRVHKLRSHTNRLRQQTTRIMSNFASKGPSGSSAVNCTPLRR